MDPDDYSAHEPDEVFNQPPALANYNLFEYDLPLREALHREGGGWIEAQAHEYGHSSVQPRRSSSVSLPTAIRRCFAPMTDSDIASTK